MTPGRKGFEKTPEKSAGDWNIGAIEPCEVPLKSFTRLFRLLGKCKECLSKLVIHKAAVRLYCFWHIRLNYIWQIAFYIQSCSSNIFAVLRN